MTPTTDQIIDGILERELHPSERRKPWDAVVARERAADRGGWTRAGITAKTLGLHRKLGRQATRAELDAMSEQECRAIYHALYVGPFAMVPEPLRSLLVDWAVTSGPDDPTRALQRALAARGVYADAIDGIFGLNTRAALIHDPDQHATYRDVLRARVRFYVALALDDAAVARFLEAHPTVNLHNLRGWVNRALEFAR